MTRARVATIFQRVLDDLARQGMDRHLERQIVARLFRRHVPDMADRIDSTTLVELGSERAGPDRGRDYPHAMWWAHTTDGEGRVAVFLDFQHRPDPVVSLCKTTRACFELEEILGLHGLRMGERLPEVVSIVLYPGEQLWRPKPRQLAHLVVHFAPGAYHLVVSRDDDSTPREVRDVLTTVLELSTDRTLPETGMDLPELKRAVERLGSEDFERFMLGLVEVQLDLPTLAEDLP